MDASKRSVGVRGRLLQASGWLAGLVLVALLSPGVEWVRADSTSAPISVADGPSCDAGPASHEVSTDLIYQLEQLRAQAAARPPSSNDEYVFLNNRGYNYGPVPTPDPARFDSIQ